MKKDWSDFLLPCSGIDAIFTKPQSVRPLNKKDEKKLVDLSALDEKTQDDWDAINALRAKAELYQNPPLSKTAMSFLTERYAWFKYEKRMATKGSYLAFLEKGNLLESPSIQVISNMDNIRYIKNEVKKTNDYLVGIPDIVDEEHGKIIDIKASWNLKTFLSARNGLDDKYWFQAQGYMDLFNVETSEICFVLLNTPDEIVQREFSKIVTSFVLGEITKEAYDEKMTNLSGAMVYNNIPIKRRVLRYRVDRDKTIMPIIYKNVEKCRDFLKTFDKEHMKNKIIVSLPPKKVNAKESSPELDTDFTSPNDTGG